MSREKVISNTAEALSQSLCNLVYSAVISICFHWYSLEELVSVFSNSNSDLLDLICQFDLKLTFNRSDAWDLSKCSEEITVMGPGVFNMIYMTKMQIQKYPTITVRVKPQSMRPMQSDLTAVFVWPSVHLYI